MRNWSSKTWETVKNWPPQLHVAIAAFLLHMIFGGGFGYHHDELYFVATGRRGEFGYVDNPPLVPWIGALSDWLFGGALRGLRLAPALASAASIYLTGSLARRLGGGAFAQTVAATAVLIAPVYLRTGNLLCIPAFEPLFWVAASYLLLRIIQEDRPRLWLWIGLLAGLGLMTKHTMLFFGFGLVIGLLLTGQRKQLASPWLWLGGAIAVAVFLPNLVWQQQNGWPTLEFIKNLNQGAMSRISRGEFLLGQLLYENLINAPLWVLGLWFYFSARGRRYRVLGWIYVVVLALLLAVGSKIYYLAPAYLALFAAGSVRLEELLAPRTSPALRPAVIAVMIVAGLVFAPVSLPLLDIETTDAYVTAVTFGALENAYELTADLHDQFGWEELVALTDEAYQSLPPDERTDAIILTFSRATAAAIEFFGEDLPAARSGDMSYHLWGWGGGEPSAVVAVGIRQETLEKIFDDITVVGTFSHEHVNPWRNNLVVAVGREMKLPMEDLWPQIKDWN